MYFSTAIDISQDINYDLIVGKGKMMDHGYRKIITIRTYCMSHGYINELVCVEVWTIVRTPDGRLIEVPFNDDLPQLEQEAK